MIFNVSGGGGTALNFRVVGGATAPTNPAENCIWVNTDTPITSWIFSATEPSPAEAGMVWISTGTSSAVEFNALKRNGIHVYPISAKQYVDGAWLDKTAKSYQAGAWTEWWNGVLFDNGDNTEVTGGWRQGGDVTTFTVSEHIYLHATNFSDGGYGMTNNAIDLAGYSSILVNCDSIGVDTDGRSKVYVSSSFGSDMAASVSITGTGEYSMDISNLQGLYYIGVFSKDNGDFSVNKIVVKA